MEAINIWLISSFIGICSAIIYYRTTIVRALFAIRQFYQRYRRERCKWNQFDILDVAHAQCALAQTEEGLIDITRLYNYLVDYNMLSSTQLCMGSPPTTQIYVWFAYPHDKISAIISPESNTCAVWVNETTSLQHVC